jgi:hypothetical protein
MEHCPFCDNNDTCPGNDVAAEIVRLRAVRDAAETLFASLAPKDAPIKVPTQTLIDINNLGIAIVAAREAECRR